MKISLFSFLALGAGLLLNAPLRAEPALLSHPQLEIHDLDDASIKALLLGKRVTVGSTRVVIVIAKTGAAQEAFLQSHVGMSTSQFQNYWRRLFMTGGGSAPKIVETEAEACQLAASISGAIVMADRAAGTGLAVISEK